MLWIKFMINCIGIIRDDSKRVFIALDWIYCFQRYALCIRNDRALQYTYILGWIFFILTFKFYFSYLPEIGKKKRQIWLGRITWHELLYKIFYWVLKFLNIFSCREMLRKDQFYREKYGYFVALLYTIIVLSEIYI